MPSLNRLVKSIRNTKIPRWLTFVIVFSFLLRIPSFFEPYYYGDEMIYLTLGEAIKQGKTLYLEIHDNKPPLLYIMAALTGSVFWFRMVLAFWNTITIYVFYKLSVFLFPKKANLQKLSVFIFAILTTIPLLEGNIANAENFMILPTILAFYLLLTKRNTFKLLFISGLLLSAASLFKIPAAFELPVIFFYWLITEKKLNTKTILNISYKFLIIVAGFLLPILLSILYYYAKGAGWDYLVAAYLQNVGYLSSFRPDDVQEPFLVKNLPLIIRGVIVVAATAVLYVFRKKLSRQFLLLTLWLFFTLFAVALSERPYPHYLIQIVPAFSLLLGMLVTLNNIEQSLSVIPLFFAFLVPFYYRFWYYPTASYYTRFISYATGSIDTSTYLEGFGGNVVRNYRIAKYLNNTMEKEDVLFVWGDNASIYALTAKLPPIKYTVDYHIHDFYTKEAAAGDIANLKPQFVVVQAGSEEFAEINTVLNLNYYLINVIDGAEIWKLNKNQVQI